ncbi:MAG: hypothetical protein B7X48_00840 [Acidiphilium sp. 34-60-192]|nr:MAG: hypothetical protein B7X48_00840 [Acidiphilium sp. 34-60-192]
MLPLPNQMASTKPMRAIFAARGGAQALLDVEAALARANAALGMISAEAADAICAACHARTLDCAALAQAGAHAGTIVIPLVAWLRSQVPDHAEAVHRAGTSQDIIDTALVLQIHRGLSLLDDDAAAMASSLAQLARTYATTPMLARTLLQPALPSTFGLKAAHYLTMIDDLRGALRAAATEALTIQYGGAAGTLDGVSTNAPAFIAAFATALGLPAPALSWHTRRAPLARLGCAIAAGLGSLGKIATDMILMMQAEVAELAEPAAAGRGGLVRAASLRAPHLAATLLSAIPQAHERAAGEWQAEQAVWPDLMLTASGAFAAMRETLAGLVIDPAAMARNLAFAPGVVVSAVIPALIERACAQHDTCSDEP